MFENINKHLILFLNDYIKFKEKVNQYFNSEKNNLNNNEIQEKIESNNNVNTPTNLENDKEKKDNFKNNNGDKTANENEMKNEEDSKSKEIEAQKKPNNEGLNNKEIKITEDSNSLQNNNNLNKDKFLIINPVSDNKENKNKDNTIILKDDNENINNSLLNKKREKSESEEKNQNKKEINYDIGDTLKKIDNIINKNSPNLNEENDENIYDVNEHPEKFAINGNVIKGINLEGNKHYFVFANESKAINMNQNTIFVIKFEILEEIGWLSFGLCDKKIVEQNNYNFAGKFTNNGYFFLATNNVIWHCTDIKQRKKILCPRGIKKLGAKNNIISCKYAPSSGKLMFFVNEIYIDSLSDVKPILSNNLLPCIVFLKNCSVKTIFEYPF